MKGNEVVKRSAFNSVIYIYGSLFTHPYHLPALFLKCILIVQHVLYKRNHTAMIVAWKTANCSFYSI